MSSSGRSLSEMLRAEASEVLHHCCTALVVGAAYYYYRYGSSCFFTGSLCASSNYDTVLQRDLYLRTTGTVGNYLTYVLRELVS